MELKEAILKRRSVRAYTDVPAPRELISHIIDSAIKAPSSCNLQLEQFVFIDDKPILEKLGQEASYKFKTAPSFIIVLHDTRFTVARYSGVMSAGMAVENMLLTAVDLGLSACPMAGFSNDHKIRKILSIPDELEILLIISIGYADENVVQRSVPKVPSKNIFHLNSYNKSLIMNDSPKLHDWTIEEVIDYRSRIAPVYLDRFRLNTYSEKLYNVALDLFKKNLIQKLSKDSQVLDVMSYDGVWLKTLIGSDEEKRFEYTASDYLVNNANFLAENFKIKSALINEDNKIKIDNKYQVATFVFQNEFTPKLPELFNSVTESIDKDGYLFIAIRSQSWVVRLIKWGLLFYKKNINRIPYNVYENNTFYKIGPKRNVSVRAIKSFAKNIGLRFVSLEEAGTGKTGESVTAIIFQK